MSQTNPATPPAPQSPAPVKSATDARQAVMTGRLRWILGVSIVLAIVAMFVASRF